MNQYEEFSAALIRQIGAALGVPYQDMVRDYRAANSDLTVIWICGYNPQRLLPDYTRSEFARAFYLNEEFREISVRAYFTTLMLSVAIDFGDIEMAYFAGEGRVLGPERHEIDLNEIPMKYLGDEIQFAEIKQETRAYLRHDPSKNTRRRRRR